MCGRYVLKRKDLDALMQQLGVKDPRAFIGRYNIAPTTLIPAVRPREGGREGVLLQWGLVPRWAQSPKEGARMANARAESIATKPAFRDAFRKRRCVVPASGFYEWQTIGKIKHPWYFQFRDESPFLFAGIWESWRSVDGVELETCSLITTEANAVVSPLHDRMPVIVRGADADRWLDPAVQDPSQLEPLLKPTPGEWMTGTPVSPRVNSVRNDGPECLERVEPPAATPAPSSESSPQLSLGLD